MGDQDIYLTLAAPSEGIYKEKGSKFLAFAHPANSEAQVKAVLDGLKKKYFDARHHCYAFILGHDGMHSRANDGGEPNHSAGDPILGQIRSRKLTNVLVVVIRYFGGVKLGVGGLVSAYKTAASEALNAAQVVEEVVKYALDLQFSYEQMNAVMKIVKDQELETSAQDFGINCRMTVQVRRSRQEIVTEFFRQAGAIVAVREGFID